MSLLPIPLTSLRKALPWSNSLQAWHERLGDVVLISGILAAAAIGIFFNLAWWELPIACGFCLLPALVLSRMGWLKIFGPVLYYDMIRQARRSRFAAFRFFYVLLLVFLLFCVTVSVTELFDLTTNAHLGAEIAQKYFNVFMAAQFITVVLLTPAYVGGAIAEEKDRKTLEFMLATDLLNREIVLSKLGSRLANLALVVLTGLPILGILQFLGGVDPNLVLAGFAVTAMTIVGQAGVGILCSVACRRPRDAVALAYLTVIAYYALSLMLALAIAADKDLAAMPIWFGEDPPTFSDAVGVYNKGNLVAFIVAVKSAGTGGAWYGAADPGARLFHFPRFDRLGLFGVGRGSPAPGSIGSKLWHGDQESRPAPAVGPAAGRVAPHAVEGDQLRVQQSFALGRAGPRRHPSGSHLLAGVADCLGPLEEFLSTDQRLEQPGQRDEPLAPHHQPRPGLPDDAGRRRAGLDQHHQRTRQANLRHVVNDAAGNQVDTAGQVGWQYPQRALWHHFAGADLGGGNCYRRIARGNVAPGNCRLGGLHGVQHDAWPVVLDRLPLVAAGHDVDDHHLDRPELWPLGPVVVLCTGDAGRCCHSAVDESPGRPDAAVCHGHVPGILARSWIEQQHGPGLAGDSSFLHRWIVDVDDGNVGAALVDERAFQQDNSSPTGDGARPPYQASFVTGRRLPIVSRPHLLFVTGKLAEPSLRRSACRAGGGGRLRLHRGGAAHHGGSAGHDKLDCSTSFHSARDRPRVAARLVPG